MSCTFILPSQEVLQRVVRYAQAELALLQQQFLLTELRWLKTDIILRELDADSESDQKW